MATSLPQRPRTGTLQRKSFAIVASAYNARFVDGLVEHFRQEILELIPGAEITRHDVPGSFEIPLVVAEIAQNGKYDAIAAFGVIMQGETLHAQLISTAVTNALLDISLKYRTPVLHEVLVIADEAQATQRCLEPGLNRGIEAARAAVHILQTLVNLRGH